MSGDTSGSAFSVYFDFTKPEKEKYYITYEMILINILILLIFALYKNQQGDINKSGHYWW
jgi:hypothetical protein